MSESEVGFATKTCFCKGSGKSSAGLMVIELGNNIFILSFSFFSWLVPEDIQGHAWKR